MLENKINNVKEISNVIKLTEKTKNEYLIEYDRLDNFFSLHFKEIDNSPKHNFQEKITYCLQEYKKESSKILSSSNLMKLQENFLNGAENTLYLYFLLDQKVRREIRLSDIIIGENNSKLFIGFLQKKKFIDENNNLLVDQKSSFIRIHRFLKDNRIINPDFQDTTIIEAMENEYKNTFDKGTFSRAINVKPTDFEESLYVELSKVLDFRY